MFQKEGISWLRLVSHTNSRKNEIYLKQSGRGERDPEQDKSINKNITTTNSEG